MANACDSGNADSLTDQDHVQPAAAPFPASGGPEFLTDCLHVFADCIRQFGHERALPHAGRIGLADADDAVDSLRTDAAAATGVAGHRIGRRHIGIGSMIDIQMASLGAFKENLLAASDFLFDNQGCVCHKRFELFGISLVFVKNLLRVQRRFLKEPCQIKILLFDIAHQFLPKGRFVQQVTEADTHTGHLVLVSQSDPPARGSDFSCRFSALPAPHPAGGDRA